MREYLLRGDRQLPGVVNLALNAAWGNLTSGLASRTIRNNVADMARRFIVGRDPKEAMPALQEMDSEGLAFTVDLLGEATMSDAEARCLSHPLYRPDRERLRIGLRMARERHRLSKSPRSHPSREHLTQGFRALRPSRSSGSTGCSP